MKSFSTSQFHCSDHSGGVVFTAEASELGLPPGQRPVDRLHPMVTMEGLQLVSEKTGVIVTYYLQDENEQGWELHPTMESIRRVPACAGTMILIFND